MVVELREFVCIIILSYLTAIGVNLVLSGAIPVHSVHVLNIPHQPTLRH